MPELPEVETVKRSLAPIIGQIIEQVEIITPSLLKYPSSEEFVFRAEGQRINLIKRKGKYLFIGMEKDLEMIIHLGMTGRLLYAEEKIALERHCHWQMRLSKGYLRYIDPRRFGRLILGKADELNQRGLYPILGDEPFDLTVSGFYDLLSVTQAPLKAFLLDQKKIAGLGNIYADESCFLSGVDPRRPSNSLSMVECQNLLTAMVAVLNEGIAKRGSSIRDYRDGQNQKGGMQYSLLVYGRSGEICVNCSTLLSSQRLAGRQTVFCTTCQG